MSNDQNKLVHKNSISPLDSGSNQKNYSMGNTWSRLDRGNKQGWTNALEEEVFRGRSRGRSCSHETMLILSNFSLLVSGDRVLAFLYRIAQAFLCKLPAKARMQCKHHPY